RHRSFCVCYSPPIGSPAVNCESDVIQLFWRLRLSCISVVVVTAPQTTGLRINSEMAGLLILRSHDLEGASLMRYHDVAPAVRSHFLANLVLGYRAIAGNESRPAVSTLSIEIKGSDACHQHK